jgi:hypothetical protein
VVPHPGSTRVHVPVGKAGRFNAGSKLKAVEHHPGGFGHGGLGNSNIGLKAVDRRAYQQCIVYRCADLDTAFDGKTTRKPQHLGAVGLHRKIRSERAL